METRARVKMADVAARAGVSVATVSKVVNGRYGVAKETIEAVNAVIEEMGYVGNLSASSLRSHTTNVIGILIASFEPYSTELIKGCALATRGTQYELLAHAGGETLGWERRSLARMGGTLMDGAVVVTPTVMDPNNVVPVVAIDPHYGPNYVPTIDVDSYGGAVSAIELLLSLGHRRIAFMGGRAELDSSREREKGYRDTMKKAGVDVDPTLVCESRYDPDIATQRARELLSRPDRPTAIFCANDVTAMRTTSVARELGLRIPDDVSVVGFDDIPEASLNDPPLTTVRQPLGEMGREAMTMLLDLLAGREREKHLRMQTELVVRGTTGPPPAH